MFEKNLTVALLLDFYGDVLSEHTHALMDMYYNEDLSLAEIAESVGITRQAVRQAVKKGEEELVRLEERLCLCQQAAELRPVAEELLRVSALPMPEGASTLVLKAQECARLILNKQREVGHVSRLDREADGSAEKVPQ